jgi:dipeptidyl-peptidase 4
MRITLLLIAITISSFCLIAQPAFSLEDIALYKKFEPNQLQGLHFVDENSWTTLEQSEGVSLVSQVVLYRSDSFDKKVLLHSGILSKVLSGNDLRVDSYQILGDGSFLLSRETESIYRYSTKAFYYYVHVPSQKVLPLFPDAKQMYPALSPDQSRIAFVVDNDLYAIELASGKTTRLTFDGQYNAIINGSADWVYEEEFSLTSAFKWSPDSKHIAYLKFDETEVKEFSMDYFRGDYPQPYRFKYPRAGEQNSLVSVWLVDLKKQKSKKVPLEAEYFPRIKWRNDGQLGIMSMPRFQNELSIHLYHPDTDQTQLLYREEDKRYIDLPTCFEFMPDGELAISSEQSGYNHLYLLDLSGREIYRTKGSFDIAAVKQINTTAAVAYLQIHGPTPERTSVIKWNFKTATMQYLTDTTGMADAKIFHRGAFIEYFNSGKVRNRVAVRHENREEVRYLLNDERAQDSILGTRQFFSIPVNGQDLHAWMLLPPNFDSAQVYPVLFFVYGGPGHQTVLNNFPKSYQLWLHYMAQLGYIVVSVDQRGTGGRGADFKKMTYTRLGQLEVEDHLAAAEWVGALPFADANRMAIFGWSYGGYMSLLNMMQEKKVFKAAISVAPVTHWRFYDTVYSERYMRTPIANPAGYERTAPTLLANQLEGDLLLVHGTADDNVHFQQSLELIKALHEAGKQYQFLAYPNKDHGIGGGKTRLHLYQAMTRFLEKALKE